MPLSERQRERIVELLRNDKEILESAERGRAEINAGNYHQVGNGIAVRFINGIAVDITPSQRRTTPK